MSIGPGGAQVNRHPHKFPGLAHRQRTEQQGMSQCKDGGIRANAQREREHRSQGEPR